MQHHLSTRFSPNTPASQPPILHCLALLAFALLFTLPTWAASPGPGPMLGTNVGFVNETSGEWPFIDLAKSAGVWVPGIAGDYNCWGCSAAGSLQIDALGNVASLDDSLGQGAGQVAHRLHFGNLKDDYHPSGYYDVVWEGEGTLVYDGCASLVDRDATGKRDRIYLDPAIAEPLLITLTSTGTATGTDDHLKNLRILPDGGACSNAPATLCGTDTDCDTGATCERFADHHEDQIFHPDFLANLEPFDVVRVMDWWNINAFSYTDYAEIPTRQHAHWHIVPGEVIARLAAIADVDLWVTIPHAASQQFLDDFADELAPHIGTGRKVYIEYSGEVWNGSFPQFEAVTLDGCAAYSNDLDCNATDADPWDLTPCQGHPWPTWVEDCNTARIRQTADRARQVWRTFVDALGIDKVVRVMGSQLGNPYLHQDLLSWNNTYLDTDALATAAYFGWTLGDDTAVAGWQLPTLMDTLRDVEVPATIGWMRDDVQFLANNPAYSHIDPIFYEGGQHLQAFGELVDDPDNAALLDAMNALFDEANRDVAMSDRYRELLDGWLSYGGGVLFMHYANVHAYREWGRFGALEHQDQTHTDAPKYNALETFSTYLTTLP